MHGEDCCCEVGHRGCQCLSTDRVSDVGVCTDSQRSAEQRVYRLGNCVLSLVNWSVAAYTTRVAWLVPPTPFSSPPVKTQVSSNFWGVFFFFALVVDPTIINQLFTTSWRGL